MKRITSFLIASVTLISCTNHTSSESSSKPVRGEIDTVKSTAAAIPADTTFRLDFFQAIPDTIDGCGEFFTYDTSQIKNGQYIFLSNLTSFAILKINGKDVFLSRDEKESKEIDDSNYIVVYKGQRLKAILTIRKAEAYDEGGLYFGTLEIISNKVKATFKVRGESGC